MSERIHILLVEDSASDARLVLEALAEAGAAVELEHVGTLTAALAVLASGSFDVVLTDLSLPDARGMESVHAILAAKPGQPVVVLTGQDSERTWLEALHSGAQEYLPKDKLEVPGEILRLIRQAIERAHAPPPAAGGGLERLERCVERLTIANAKSDAAAERLKGGPPEERAP